MNRFIILFLFSLGILSTCVFAVEVIPLNEGWNFHRGFQAPASEIVKVTLPHTWINPEKPDVPLNKNDAFQKVQKRRVQEKR